MFIHKIIKKYQGVKMKNKTGFTGAALLGILTFAVGLTIISTLLVPISKEYRFSVDKSGILFTANFLGFIIFNVVFSMFSSRVDKRKVLIICTIIFSIFTYLFTTASTFGVLLIYMTIVGGVGGIIESLTGTMVVEINKERAGFYLNFTQVFFGIGALVGPIMAGYLDGLGYSWRIMFIATSVLAIISAILLMIFKVEGLTRQEELHVKELGKVFRIKDFNFMIIAMILYVGAEISVWGWISTLLKNQFNITPFKSSLSVGIFWSFMIIGRLITAKLTDKMSLKNVIILLSSGGTLFTFLLVFMKSEISIWILLALIGLAYSGIWATILAYGGKAAVKYSSSAYFLVVAAGGIGGMIFPYLLGILGKAASISVTLGSISIMMLLIVILTMLTGKDSSENR
jgi:FHS family glucose/mannose:H+ symporter-like MFS transporter